MSEKKTFDFKLPETGQLNVEQFQKLIEQNQQALSEYCEKNQETLGEILEMGFKYGALWQEYINEQMRRLSNAKDINDVIAAEAGLTTEYSAKFNEANTRLYDLLAASVSEQLKDIKSPAEIEKLLSIQPASKKKTRKK